MTMREQMEALGPYYEWISWKIHKLTREREHDLVLLFHQQVMEIMRLPIGVLETAVGYGLEPIAVSSVSRLRGTVEAVHPIERWLDTNPEPLAGTLAAMKALKERWGDKTALPVEPTIPEPPKTPVEPIDDGN